MKQVSKYFDIKLAYWVLVISLFVLFMFLHLYKLDTIANSINVDEAGLWYNVKCLLNYGVDQANNSWPLLPANFFGEQSAMYTYLALICVKLFGDTLFAIRLPAALCSCCIFIFGGKIINYLYGNKKINILFFVLCVISPYIISAFRIALDCNLMLCFSTICLWFFIKAIDLQKNKWFFISGLLFGFLLYTYVLSYAILPVFLCIVFAYLYCHKKITKQQIVLFGIPLFIIAFPLIYIQLINILDLQEVVIGHVTLTKFFRGRHSDYFSNQIIKNIPSVLTYILFGNDMIFEKINFSNFYLFSVIFICLGFFSTLKTEILNILQKKFSIKLLFIIWWFISVFMVSFSSTVFLHQCNAIFFIQMWLLIEGFLFVLGKLNKTIIRKTFLIIVVAIYLVSTICFWGYYFGENIDNYNNDYYNCEQNLSNYDISEIVKVIKEKQYTKVYWDVNNIYYKIVTNEHPQVHPGLYYVEYNDEKCKEVVGEIIYAYENGYVFFKYLTDIFNTSNYNDPNIIFVISQKSLSKILTYIDYDYNLTKVGNYYILEATK